MTIETLHLFKNVVGGDYLRKEKPQKGRQDREYRHIRQNARDRPDRQAEYDWHLTLSFQDTCGGQLSQFLRCFSNFNMSDILKVMSVDGRRHCNCGWQGQPFDIIMYHFSLNILQSMRVRVWWWWWWEHLKVFDCFKLCDNTNFYDINKREKEETDVSKGE